MQCIILLSKENLKLARDEALSITKMDYGIYDNLLITDYFKGLETKLGFSHKIFEFLFQCRKDELDETIQAYDWQTKYDQDFCVRTHGTDEKMIAKQIFRKLKDPKVKLRNSRTIFEFFISDDIALAGRFIADIDKGHLKRKAHLRPSLHPTSMNPALAKACINLTGLKKGTILDPFCGSGGILIEASLMGFDVIGYDIDEKQIKRAKTNLDFYKAKSSLHLMDALSSTKKADAIVTDIPYGKGSKVDDVESLCNSFLKHSKKLTKILVLVYPDFINPDFKDWKIEDEYTIYIHKSLTRKIIKLHAPHSVSSP